MAWVYLRYCPNIIFIEVNCGKKSKEDKMWDDRKATNNKHDNGLTIMKTPEPESYLSQSQTKRGEL